MPYDTYLKQVEQEMQIGQLQQALVDQEELLNLMQSLKAQLVRQEEAHKAEKVDAAEQKRYNGWANYPTWNVLLHINNDGSSEFWMERALELVKENTSSEYSTLKEVVVYALQAELKESHETMAEEAGLSGCLSDIMGLALQQVDWYEIAESLYDDADEEYAFKDDMDEEEEADVL